MARIAVTSSHGVDVVTLPASSRVIGVLLRENLQYTDTRVRPTNVTATIGTEIFVPATPSTTRFATFTIATATQIVGDEFSRDVTFTGGVLNAGDEIRITSAAGTGVFDAVVTGRTGTNLHIRITSIETAGTLGGLVTLAFLAHDSDHEPDYILLQNGPKGGFRQELSVPAGLYRVNGVIKALITA